MTVVSIHTCPQVLKESQLGHQRLSVKYKDLRTKYEALKASTKSAKVKNGRKPLSTDDKAIALAGGRFAFAYELWVDGLALCYVTVGTFTRLEQRFPTGNVAKRSGFWF